MDHCEEQHRHEDLFEELPLDQGGHGRHRCAGCAYNRGLNDGVTRREQVDLDLDSLPFSQAGTVRHRSPHAAWAMGYVEGVRRSYP